ncbi:hypothetical protein HII36_23795, partial [Nonomuraea sp. NN258]|uniref:type IV secretion system protein n=1 Tax=Nonomuraea antri TaxID=2730852 RepID=UPI0015689109
MARHPSPPLRDGRSGHRLIAVMLAVACLLATTAHAAPVSASTLAATPSPTPVPIAEPTPTPSPQVSLITPPSTSESEGCEWLDVGCKINQAMNRWLGSIITEAVTPVFVLVGTVLLSSPPPSMLARVQELSAHVRMVANALLVLFVMAAGLIVMAGGGGAGTASAVKEVVPRLVVAALALNLSLTVCQYAIELANGLVAALLGDGVDKRRAGDLLADKLHNPSELVDAAIFLLLMIGVAVLMGLILAFVAVLRVALLLFLIIAAPLALLCHALPQTEHIARLWWRSFAGLLLMQVLQALVLIMAFKVHFTDATDAFAVPPDQPALASVKPTMSRTIDALVLIGLLFILIKIPGWVARSIWHNAQPQLLKRLITAVIVYKTFGLARTALTKAKSPSARGSRRSGPPPGPGAGTRRGPHGPRPTGGPAARRGAKPMPSTPSSTPPAATTGSKPQQLALPLGLPHTSQQVGSTSGRGRQLA